MEAGVLRRGWTYSLGKDPRHSATCGLSTRSLAAICGIFPGVRVARTRSPPLPLLPLQVPNLACFPHSYLKTAFLIPEIPRNPFHMLSSLCNVPPSPYHLRSRQQQTPQFRDSGPLLVMPSPSLGLTSLALSSSPPPGPLFLSLGLPLSLSQSISHHYPFFR